LVIVDCLENAFHQGAIRSSSDAEAVLSARKKILVSPEVQGLINDRDKKLAAIVAQRKEGKP
jgi:hypothetical protein